MIAVAAMSGGLYVAHTKGLIGTPPPPELAAGESREGKPAGNTTFGPECGARGRHTHAESAASETGRTLAGARGRDREAWRRKVRLRRAGARGSRGR